MKERVRALPNNIQLDAIFEGQIPADKLLPIFR